MKKFNDFINESVSYEDVELSVKKFITENEAKISTFMKEIQKMDDEGSKIYQMINDMDITPEIDGKLETLMEPFEKMYNMINAFIEATDPEFIHFRPGQKYDMNNEEV